VSWPRDYKDANSEFSKKWRPLLRRIGDFGTGFLVRRRHADMVTRTLGRPKVNSSQKLD
jgi:hypothetical protein